MYSEMLDADDLTKIKDTLQNKAPKGLNFNQGTLDINKFIEDIDQRNNVSEFNDFGVF
jgi:hypothetical protein